MSGRITINLPLNRVEGDLDLKVEVEGGTVRDAWVSATLFRGFERMLVGRGRLDGLVITPRICGICTTAHLTAAVTALDQVAHAVPPPDAVRMRNAALMCEVIQSDVRQPFLMFACDFAADSYRDRSWHAEAVRRYAPFQGETAREVIRETKKLLEVVAIIGGQWPHSSFMVPGGITSMPADGERRQCRMIVEQFKRWYERRILGCPVERFAAVRSAADLDAWLAQKDHAQGDLGFLLTLMKETGLDRLGIGHGAFLSAGAYPMPEGTNVAPLGPGKTLIPAGFVNDGGLQAFEVAKITEQVASSWYRDEARALPPSEGRTEPYATGEGSHYSFSKAARYDGRAAETGPLAEQIVAGHPLFVDLVRSRPNAFARQLARAVRPVYLLAALEAWLTERDGGRYYTSPGEVPDGEGVGLLQATRGILGHWVKIEGGLIRHYQIVTPTTWNGSPRDGAGQRGPIEQALLGTPIKDPADPVELGHVVRSFDPCLACTVHTVSRGRTLGRLTVGV